MFRPLKKHSAINKFILRRDFCLKRPKQSFFNCNLDIYEVLKTENRIRTFNLIVKTKFLTKRSLITEMYVVWSLVVWSSLDITFETVAK